MIDKPELTDPILYGYLAAATKEYVDFLWSDDYNEDRAGDYRNAIFEAAVEAVYGKAVWEKINARMHEAG